jgi:hypothetical protein
MWVADDWHLPWKVRRTKAIPAARCDFDQLSWTTAVDYCGLFKFISYDSGFNYYFLQYVWTMYTKVKLPDRCNAKITFFLVGRPKLQNINVLLLYSHQVTAGSWNPWHNSCHHAPLQSKYFLIRGPSIFTKALDQLY